MHTIRLHGPWQLTWTALDADQPHVEGRVRLPLDRQPSPQLGIPSLPGRLTLTRRFQWPPDNRAAQVFLVVDARLGTHLAAWTDVRLNKATLGGQGRECLASDLPWRADVTALLEPSNLLELELHPFSAQQWAQLQIQAVRLEILDPPAVV